MKRLISILLICCSLLMALVACGGKEEETNPPAGSDGTAEGTDVFGQQNFVSAVPADVLDFEDKELTVLVRKDEKVSREWYKEAIEDELDQAVSDRNKIVEDDLGLKVNFDFQGDYNHGTYVTLFVQLVNDDVASGLHEFDMVAHYAYAATLPAFRDSIANMADKDMFPYFGFDRPCWNKAIIDNSLVNEKLYYVAGDLNLSMFDSAMVIWHNKDLYNKYKTDKDPADLQQLAVDGNWTYMELYRWATLVEKGNSLECDGVYGMSIGREVNPADAIPYAWDLEFVTVNNDGTHSFNIVGNDKAADALETFRLLRNSQGNAPDCVSGSGCTDHFVNGQRIFYTYNIYGTKEFNRTLREMEDEYALLPFPMYDENQMQYGTTSQDYYSLMSVLSHSDLDGEAVSAYLQYANEKSYTDVRGFYFKRIVEPKYFGGVAESATLSIELFNTIVDNIEFSFEGLYSTALNDIAHLWRKATMDETETSTLKNLFEANQAKYEQELEKTDAWLGLGLSE